MSRPGPDRRLLLAATAALVLTGAAAGCGSSGDGGHAGHDGAAATTASDSMAGMPGMDHSGGDTAAMGDMATLGSLTKDGVKISAEAMAPETFFVADGASQVKHSPGSTDAIHLMVTLADDESGIRLPDASVTAQLTGPDGKRAFDGPLYPMIGRGMGMHYGENVTLAAKGTYALTLIAGPPRIGRHVDVENAWSKTTRVPLTFTWDGEKATAVS